LGKDVEGTKNSDVA